MYVCMYVCINFLCRSKVKIKLVTLVEGDQNAPFSIGTTPRCSGGRYSFPLDCSALPLIHTLYC